MVLIAEHKKSSRSPKPPLPAREVVVWRKARITEHTQGHYEFQEVPFGRVYRWCPESVAIECECGKRLSLKRTDLLLSDSATAACEGCGADLRVNLRDREGVVGHMLEDDETLHPWRYWHPREDSGIPF